MAEKFALTAVLVLLAVAFQPAYSSNSGCAALYASCATKTCCPNHLGPVTCAVTARDRRCFLTAQINTSTTTTTTTTTAAPPTPTTRAPPPNNCWLIPCVTSANCCAFHPHCFVLPFWGARCV